MFAIHRFLVENLIGYPENYKTSLSNCLIEVYELERSQDFLITLKIHYLIM